MRVAFVGKGGVGKSAISGTLARLWARDSEGVLAVDLDTSPGLALSLGVPVRDEGLSDDVLEQGTNTEYGWRLREGVTPADVVDRCAIDGPDGVRFLQLGKIGRAAHRAERGVAALGAVLRGFDRPGWHIVADLEAGPTTPYERYAAFADLVLIVVAPTPAASLAATRLASVLRRDGTPFALVANKIKDDDGIATVRTLAADLGVPMQDAIYADPAVGDADRLGLPPIDHAPASAFVHAVERMGRSLIAAPVAAAR